MHKPLILIFALLLASCSGPEAAAEDPLAGHWRLTLETPYYGTLDVLATAEIQGRYVVVSNGGQAAARLAQLPSSGEWFPLGHTIAFRMNRNADGVYEGQFASLQSTFRRGALEAVLRQSEDRVEGTIAPGGPFSGPVTGRRVPHTGAPLRNYRELHDTLRERMAGHIYDPRLMTGPDLSTTLDLQGELAALAHDDVDFAMAYAFTTARMPFSHFQVLRPEGGLEALLSSRANQGSAGEKIDLAFEGDIAVLTVRSFIGDQIPGQIADAFAQVQAQGARALIIDLRENGGGSLAGAVLANHLLAAEETAGYFVSNRWWQSNTVAPRNADVAAAPMFEGTNLEDFYAAIEQNGVLRIAALPVAQPFTGEVLFLSSSESTSMSELVLDTLQRSGRATIVGEPTPGEMVSSRFFDLGEGFVARLPVADYFAIDHTRIEGQGVTPDVHAPANEALDRALTLLTR